MSWMEPSQFARVKLDDEQFLDLALEASIEALAEGDEPALEAFEEQRPHLRPQLEELVETARSVALGQLRRLPSVSDYQLVRELGRGGMGAVYLARQLRVSGRLVALKTLPPGALHSASARERFVRETWALARLDHPGVVAVHDVIRDEHQLAYAMEWIDGPTLADVVARVRGTDAEKDLAQLFPTLADAKSARDYRRFVAGLGRQLAMALAYVHRQRLLHRDIKPSNVLLRSNGEAVLSDFGLVQPEDATHFTQTGAFIGTPAFASPEQLHGHSLDERSDVYSLGATLYFALVGVPPHPGRTSTEVARAMETHEPIALRRLDARIGRDLQTVVQHAIALDPSQRYPTAEELAEDLRRVLQDEPVRARPPGVLRRAWMFAKRHRKALTSGVGGGLLVASAAAALTAAFWWLPREIQREVREARLQLLNPTHSELLWMRFQAAKADEIQPKFRERLAQAAARFSVAEEHYDRAQRLSLGRERGELELEREAVRAAQRRLAGLAPDLDLGRWPVSRSWLDEWSVAAPRAPELAAQMAEASRADRRMAGLIAYLCGEVDAIREAWEPLDPLEGDDPLLDAALGQMYLRMGRAEWATHRLRSAVNHFDDVGFLMTDFARAAFESGEFALARALVDRSRTLPSPEPFSALEILDARLLEHEGRLEEAVQVYLALYSIRADPLIPLRLVRVLCRLGQFDAAHYYGLRSAFGRFADERGRELHKRLFERLLCERGAMIVFNCSYGEWFPTIGAPQPLARYLYATFRWPAWNAQTRARRAEMTLEKLLAEID